MPCKNTAVLLKEDQTSQGWKEATSLRQMASGKLSPNTISALLKKTIYLAYKVVGEDEELSCLHLILAHETRAFSASWDAL